MVAALTAAALLEPNRPTAGRQQTDSAQLRWSRNVANKERFAGRQRADGPREPSRAAVAERERFAKPGSACERGFRRAFNVAARGASSGNRLLGHMLLMALQK